MDGQDCEATQQVTMENVGEDGSSLHQGQNTEEGVTQNEEDDDLPILVIDHHEGSDSEQMEESCSVNVIADVTDTNFASPVTTGGEDKLNAVSNLTDVSSNSVQRNTSVTAGMIGKESNENPAVGDSLKITSANGKGPEGLSGNRTISTDCLGTDSARGDSLSATENSKSSVESISKNTCQADNHAVTGLSGNKKCKHATHTTSSSADSNDRDTFSNSCSDSQMCPSSSQISESHAQTGINSLPAGGLSVSTTISLPAEPQADLIKLSKSSKEVMPEVLIASEPHAEAPGKMDLSSSSPSEVGQLGASTPSHVVVTCTSSTSDSLTVTSEPSTNDLMNRAPASALSSVNSLHSTNSHNPDTPNSSGGATVESPTPVISTDFHPVILNVRGGCSDMDTEFEKESPASVEHGTPQSDSHISKVTGVKDSGAADVAQTMESIPKSALELLRGMIQTHQPACSQSSTSNIHMASVSSGSDTEALKSLLSLAKTACKDRGVSLSEGAQLDKGTVVDRQTSVCTNSLSFQPAFSTKLSHTDSGSRVSSSTVTSTIQVLGQMNRLAPPKTLSKVAVARTIVTSAPFTQQYQCVFVQDKVGAAKQSRLALLIPQSSISSLGNISGTMSLVTAQSLIAPLTTSVTSALSNACSSQLVTTLSSVASVTGSGIQTMSVAQRISCLVTRTLKNFRLDDESLGILLKPMQPDKTKDKKSYPQRCSVCGEGYHSSEGLNFHLQRPIFYLSFFCEHCNKIKVFHNKCTMWLHLRKGKSEPAIPFKSILEFKPFEFDKDDDAVGTQAHKTNDESSIQKRMPVTASASNVPEASSVSVSSNTLVPSVAASSNQQASSASITSGQITSLVTSSAQNVSMVATSSASRVASHADIQTMAEKVASSPTVTASMAVISSDQIPSVSTEITVTTKHKECPSCLCNFIDLPGHLCPRQGEVYECRKCGMLITSLCALQAHIRVHEGILDKMCCPECGEKKFQSDGVSELSSVFDHLDSCMHFNRVLSEICTCGQEFITEAHLKKHFVDVHLRTLFKCPFCILGFTQPSFLINHCGKIHSKYHINVESRVLCVPCSKLFSTAIEVSRHVNEHVVEIRDQATTSWKWKCFICAKTFLDQSSLRKHALQEHPHKAKRCRVCFSLFWGRKALVDHLMLKKCERSMPAQLHRCVDVLCLTKEQDVNFQQLFDKANEATASAAKTRTGVLADDKTPRSTPSKSSETQLRQYQCEKTKRGRSRQQTMAGQDSSKHQCHACKVIIVGKGNYQMHIKLHGQRGKHINQNLTRCVICRKLIDNSDLITHLKGHQTKGIIICSRCQRRDFKTMTQVIRHESNMCGYKLIEGYGDLDQLEAEKRAHTVMEDDVGNDAVGEQGSQPASPDVTETGSENEKGETQTTMFPCLLCGLAFQSLPAREQHVSRWHDGTRTVYHCMVCRRRGKGKMYCKKEHAAKHITKKHRIVDKTAVEKLIKKEEQNVSSGEKLPATEAAGDEDDGAPVPKRLRVSAEGDYLCGKCAYSCKESQMFSQHISSHNPNKEPQCPECGLCFTVLPALKKHLFAVHKIKGVEEYLKDKDIQEPEVDEDDLMDVMPEISPYTEPVTRSPRSTEESSTSRRASTSSNPLECTVCYKVFDSETNLKTHMRNHGMAFIRSKRCKQ